MSRLNSFKFVARATPRNQMDTLPVRAHPVRWSVISSHKEFILFLLCSIALMFTNLAQSATIRPVDYFDPGKVGDTWTYEDINGSQFTLARSIIASGPNAGRTDIGNDTTGLVFSVNGNLVTWYEVNKSPIEKPVTFLETYDTGVHYTVDDTNSKDSEFLFLTLSSFTVQAGTFSDVLVQVWLDSDFSPNDKNSLFALDALGITAGVTDVNWWARGIGEIKFMGVDASNGAIDGGYELVSTTVSTVPEPATLALLGLGLAGLGFSRRKKAYPL